MSEVKKNRFRVGQEKEEWFFHEDKGENVVLTKLKPRIDKRKGRVLIPVYRTVKKANVKEVA